MKKKISPAWFNFFMVAGIAILANFVSSYFSTYIDLTQDKRYTLTPATEEAVEKIDEIIYIKVLLDGEFPAGFKRLQASTREMLNQLKAINPRIQFEFENPVQGTQDEIIKTRDALAKDGVVPTSLKYYDGTQLVQKAIYPYALINIGTKRAIVNLLEEQQPGSDEEVILNNSISLLEYKFAHTFQKMLMREKQNIAFTDGSGELDSRFTYRLEKELRRFYDTGRIVLDSVVQIDSSVHLLIVAAPKQQISLPNQFKIDQYIMRGGKVIWLVEKLSASLDSIAKYQFYVPKDIITGVDDMLFKYGAKVQPNLIIDLECSAIPQIVGMAGDKPQTMMFPWYYHLSLQTKNDHVIVRNIDRVNMFFPSSIDTVATATPIKKTVLLSSSPYSRTQFNPVRLNFEILKSEPDPAKFNDGNKAVAVLLEGRFESFFKNRVSASFQQTLNQLNTRFVEESVPTAQVVFSDVDFMQNLLNTRTNETEEIGFNKWEIKYYKGNKDLILNTIEYLLDEDGVLSARSKELKLRLLDKVKAKKEKTKWQLINIVLPLLFLALSGLIYTYWRRKKYTQV
ncbi:MAG TPA: gliding motility-associated ABC transporter substrate-binding protein GldG [Saprospiraceae bacterium]|nr:gliding motility-associated ABC transporter substrate-binding protein GldG [Saprospiraceae bacterium]HRG21801.1 gliding motility-associated ABC transporter substrate-binding protein GldG [Saprospiraceae bacterium]